MKKTFVVAVFALLTLLTLSATATPLTYNGYPYGLNDGHYYVGNMSVTLDGVNRTAWCVDVLNSIDTYTWEVNAISLATPLGLDGMLGLTVNDFRAMFLLGQGFTNTNPADTNIQHAIWSFTGPAMFPLTPAQQALKSAALASVNGYDFSQAFVLTPAGNLSNWPGQVVELGVASPVPEPASMALIGGGFIALGFLRRRIKS